MNESRDVTTGSSGEISSFSLGGGSSPTREVKAIIPQVKNTIVAEQLDKLLLTISTAIKLVQQSYTDIGNIPPLIAHIDEDGAVLVEWVFPDFRVGFNLEPNPSDSGWHLISNKKFNERTISEQLKDMDDIIPQIVYFISKSI